MTGATCSVYSLDYRIVCRYATASPSQMPQSIKVSVYVSVSVVMVTSICVPTLSGSPIASRTIRLVAISFFCSGRCPVSGVLMVCSAYVSSPYRSSVGVLLKSSPTAFPMIIEYPMSFIPVSDDSFSYSSQDKRLIPAWAEVPVVLILLSCIAVCKLMAIVNKLVKSNVASMIANTAIVFF